MFDIVIVSLVLPLAGSVCTPVIFTGAPWAPSVTLPGVQLFFLVLVVNGSGSMHIVPPASVEYS